MLGVRLSDTLILEVESNPGDAVAEELLQGLAVVSATKARNSGWRALIKSFRQVVQFKNPDASLRREYYRRLNPVLTGEQFEAAIQATEGFSFAQLRETYILGAQSAFEHGREVEVGDVIEAVEMQAAGAQDLKMSIAAPGFVHETR